MTKHKSIKPAHARRSKKSAPRNLSPLLGRTPAICQVPDKADAPTNTRPRRRKPTVTSKPASTPTTFVQKSLVDFGRFGKIGDERSAWDRLRRGLARDAKKFSFKTSDQELHAIGHKYRSAKLSIRELKYEALHRVYELYIFTEIQGNTQNLMTMYEEDGLTIHKDAPPVLAIIRRHITTNRDHVTRYGSALRFAQTKGIPPEEFPTFLRKYGIERCCKEFRKLHDRSQLVITEDEPAGTRISAEVIHEENDKTTKSIEWPQALKSSKKVMGKAGDQAPIETTTDFDMNFVRIARNRKDVLVNIEGYVSADGRLSLRSVQIVDRSEPTKPRPKTQ
jgi:hypothetical protein